MRIKTLEVDGIGPALHAMRNPMDSWDRSDTIVGKIGQKDKELSVKLANAGSEHAKHLRMIMVWAEIWAPRFWWNEFDTYRAGVEKLSCSTMHKLTSRALTFEDFETENGLEPEEIEPVVDILNGWITQYTLETEPDAKKKVWRKIIQFLPQSYIQRRTVMMSYAALRNIIHQRENHKLNEWHQFIDWVHTLPESWMLFE